MTTRIVLFLVASLMVSACLPKPPEAPEPPPPAPVVPGPAPEDVLNAPVDVEPDAVVIPS